MKKKKKLAHKPTPKKLKKVRAKAVSKKAKKVVKKVAPKKQKAVASKKVAKKTVVKKQKAVAPKKITKKIVVKKQKPVKKIVQKIAVKKTKPVAKVIVKSVPKPAPKPVAKPLAKAPIKKFVMPPKPAPKVDEPRPKGLYSLEYELNSSPDVLFEFISTPGGLEKWFADRVYIIEGNYIFNWEDGEKRLAKQVGIKEKEWVRFHWLDDPEKRYFEFKIVIDDLTSEVALIVSDFADTPKELEELTRLWNQQVNDLHHSIGSA